MVIICLYSIVIIMKETIMNKAQQRHSADGNFFGSFF